MATTVNVARGDTLFRAAADVGVEIDTVCGGSGLCGKCGVRVIDPTLVPAKPIDHIHLRGDDVANGFRLSCQIEATQSLAVEVPPARNRSVRILHHGEVRDVPVRPNVLKIHVPYSPPRARDGTADWDAVRAVLPAWFRRVLVPLHWLRALPALIRDERGMTITVVGRSRVTRIVPGDTTATSFGIAVDIGSTSVVAYLVNLESGEEIGVASGLNLQAAYGDDIVGRLSRAQFDPDGLARMHELVIEQLNDVFATLVADADLDRSQVDEVTVVGNMAMHHFLLRLDSTYLGLSPYAPVTRAALTVTAEELGLHLDADTPIYVMANIAGFVGSDTVAVVLASGLADAERPMMAVDVGTNGEVALGWTGRLIACSAPAGPAFEGARISQGIRATTGAIDHIDYEGDLKVSVIDDVVPVGICGSALIDIGAVLLRTGVIDHTGTIRRESEMPAGVPDAIRCRVVEGASRKDSAVVLVRAHEMGNVEPIVFTQQDIREFQLAKGAIRAGQMVLQDHAEVADGDLSEVVLAGAFGTYIDLENARAVNLVPQVPLDRLRSGGNAAGAGAQLALVSVAERRRAERLAREAEHIRLSGLDKFQRAFTHAMRFPQLSDGAAMIGDS